MVPDDTVKVRYTKPSANPLRGADGHAVDTFADQAVTAPVSIWSATLTVKNTGFGEGCRDTFLLPHARLRSQPILSCMVV